MRILTAGVLAIAATTLGGLPGTASAQSANWSGAYVTGFGGYGTGQSAQHDNGVPVMPPAIAAAGGGGMLPIPADGSYSLGGGFGGGLVGYDVQFDRYVIGAEGSIAGGGIKGNSGACGVPPHVCGTTIDAMADVRARFGLAYGNFLPFIAAGLAVDHIKGYDSLFGVGGSAWRSGYTVGAGVEYKITPALSLRARISAYRDRRGPSVRHRARRPGTGLRADGKHPRRRQLQFSTRAPRSHPSSPAIRLRAEAGGRRRSLRRAAPRSRRRKSAEPNQSYAA